MKVLTDEVIASFKDAARKLTGPKRRAFQAQVTLDYLDGSIWKAKRVFGWSHHTVALGLNELRTGITCQGNFSARGNHKTETKSPELEADIRAWFKNARFRVTLGISARTLIGPAQVQRVYASPWLPCWDFSSARTACTPEAPASEHAAHPSATRQDSCRLDWGLHCEFPAVVQEELKQRQVVLAQLPPQEEVAAQPAVEVLDQTAGPHNPIERAPAPRHTRRDSARVTSHRAASRRHRFGSHVGRDCTCKTSRAVDQTDLPLLGQGRQITVQFHSEG